MGRRTASPAIYLPPMAAAILLLVLVVIDATDAKAPALRVAAFVLALGILGFGFADLLIRDVRRSWKEPITRRAAVLAVMVGETVCLFAVAYLGVSEVPDQMVGMSTILDAFYFTMTTLMTIGFGDVAAQGQLARGLVLTQMLFTVLVLTASVRLMSSLTRTITRDAGDGNLDEV